MAIYDNGTASLAANGQVTGIGTQWTMPLTLIRVGATLVFKTEPVQIYTISEITSDTSISVYNPNGETVPAGTGYAILAHDGITVQGLAQDVAETLRYYQSKETSIESLLQFIGQDTFDWPRFEQLANQSTTGAAEALASQIAAAESASTAVGASNNAQNSYNRTVAAINAAGNTAAVAYFAEHGIGSTTTPVLTSLDWQTMQFYSGGSYQCTIANMVNIPAELSSMFPATNINVYIDVLATRGVNGINLVRVSPFTTLDAFFRVADVTISGAAGSRNFHVRELLSVPGGDAAAGGSSALRVRGLLDVYSKSETFKKSLNLSDVDDKTTARNNLDVYSKSQIDSTLTSGDSFGYLGAFNYAQLRSYSGSLNYVHVRGRSSAGDGGQGFFYRDNSDTSSADNDGTVIVSASGVRWKRKFERLLDVRWFGLIGDGAFNNSPRLQSAVNWATQSGNKVTFYFPKGEFRFNSTVSTPGRYLFNMIGEGGLRDSSGTILKFYNDSSLTLRGSNVAGTSGPTYCNAFAESIVFSGDNINTSSPVKLVDLVGFVFDKCTFTKCLYGINMLDEFYWTESCVARNCYFSNECNTALLMRVSSSNQYVSFYGSGLDNCFIENTGTGRQKIEIASRAQPYNSPLNVTIGHTPISGTPLISHAGNDNSWFVGNVRVEVGEEFDCELVSSKPLYIVGSLTSMGGKVKTEYAYFCDDVRVDVTSNTLNYRRKPFSRYVTLPANGGGPIFQYLPKGGNQTYDIYITTTAAGYSYEQHVVMHTNYSNGTAGSVRVVETFRNYDSSSIGAPSIEYNAEATMAQLYLYRSSLPAGAIVYMDIHPRGTHVNKILG